MCQSRFIAIKGEWIAGDGLIEIICLYASIDSTERSSFLSSFGHYYFGLGLSGFHHLLRF